ncbi:MAG TPA: transposase, partial [Kofleriaceae bacterium]|nr:transposase [Kofleriaceae bacterium]
MARVRKRHVQQTLRYLDKNGQRRGISTHKRTGRPKRGERASERHNKRASVKPSEPVHVVLRVAAAVQTLRRGRIYQAVRAALVTTFSRDGFRIVHLSIQASHVHLLVEAKDRMALSRGMQAFQISAAKHINAVLVGDDGRRRRGCVFVDRYHAQAITTPRQARHTLAYVLNNWRHHGEHRQDFAHGLAVDPFSSADCFDGWQRLDI